MGPVYVNPESEWAKRIRPVFAKKESLYCDCWPSRATPLDAMGDTLADMLKSAGLSQAAENPWFAVRFRRLVRGLLLSEQLVMPFAEQFRDMTEPQIDAMMQSFAFKNCLKRDALVEALKTKMASPSPRK
jgi:hypothetical protein